LFLQFDRLLLHGRRRLLHLRRDLFAGGIPARGRGRLGHARPLSSDDVEVVPAPCQNAETDSSPGARGDREALSV
jgi:hypothetical protein